MTKPITTLNYPETMLLRPSGWRNLRLLLTAAVFSLIGSWMIRDGDVLGWFVLITFGIGFLVGVVYTLPGASGLVVMRDGFATRSLFRTRFYPWRDVEGFGVYELRSHGMKVHKAVGFNLRGASAPRGTGLSAALVGYSCALPETYGMAAEELATALDLYRRAALDDPTIASSAE